MSYLYVLENTDNGNIKIGVSNKPKKRMTLLKTQGGFRSRKYKIFGPFNDAYKVEGRIHSYFSKERYIGEWFKLDFDKNIDKIEEVAIKASGKKRKSEEMRIQRLTKGFHVTPSQKRVLKHIDMNQKYDYVHLGINLERSSTLISLEKMGLIKRIVSSDKQITSWVSNDEN